VPIRKTSLAIIGAGRVGRALGHVLHQRGWRIGTIVTRSKKTGRAAVSAIGAGHPQSILNASALSSDVILITTPDRVIAPIAAKLAKIVAWVVPPPSSGRPKALPLASKIVLHTNGALDRSVLSPLEKLGAATGSLHPLQTFGRNAVPQLAGCICAIEGTPRALRIASRIARQLGCVPVKIAAKDKPAYHAAGALAAGHVLAVVEAATCILISAGFTRKQAVLALLPLTRQTLANFERVGANAAWTGPLARGDYATVKQHEAALRKFPREYRDAYRAISKLALKVLQEKTRRDFDTSRAR
jgi:predicted short-subunit dehydrogenase-like oxidoreductase (DUF2520 family)